MIQARDLYAYGNVEVGDEHGVQGRFQKFFGDVLNTIFESQSTTEENIDIRFADFKCIQSTSVEDQDETYMEAVKNPMVGIAVSSTFRG